VSEAATPVETSALVRFPDGHDSVVQLYDEPVEGEPLVAAGLDDGWIADTVTPSPDQADYDYVIDASGR
jgi:hypothetical protein